MIPTNASNNRSSISTRIMSSRNRFTN